jgi:type II secretory pathway predicted ATPase ExeA
MTASEPLEITLRTLWGAKRWPGMADSTVVLEHPGWSECMRGLDQLVALRSSGVLHGAHGMGKSYLLYRWSERLSSKQYRLIQLSHCSLAGGDLLRHLVRMTGKPPKFRKSDNVATLADTWKEWAPVWPVLVVEEAQDLSVASLEELRLLTCARSDSQQPFSLILCGDDGLLPRLELTINRALLSRMTSSLQMKPWPQDKLREYLVERLAEAGIHGDILEPQAMTLLLQAAKGSPRMVNALLQRSMEQAALANRRVLTLADAQAGVNAVPWAAHGRIK